MFLRCSVGWFVGFPFCCFGRFSLGCHVGFLLVVSLFARVLFMWCSFGYLSGLLVVVSLVFVLLFIWIVLCCVVGFPLVVSLVFFWQCCWSPVGCVCVVCLCNLFGVRLVVSLVSVVRLVFVRLLLVVSVGCLFGFLLVVSCVVFWSCQWYSFGVGVGFVFVASLVSFGCFVDVRLVVSLFVSVVCFVGFFVVAYLLSCGCFFVLPLVGYLISPLVVVLVFH